MMNSFNGVEQPELSCGLRLLLPGPERFQQAERTLPVQEAQVQFQVSARGPWPLGTARSHSWGTRSPRQCRLCPNHKKLLFQWDDFKYSILKLILRSDTLMISIKLKYLGEMHTNKAQSWSKSIEINFYSKLPFSQPFLYLLNNVLT